MKATINGKRYDTDKCEVLGEFSHYSYSNTYCGTTKLLRAADGTLLEYTDSNGQDLYLNDSLTEFDGDIDKFNLDEDQEKRCAELGLITLVWGG